MGEFVDYECNVWSHKTKILETIDNHAILGGIRERGAGGECERGVGGKGGGNGLGIVHVHLMEEVCDVTGWDEKKTESGRSDFDAKKIKERTEVL